jgi:hypothetical protein
MLGDEDQTDLEVQNLETRLSSLTAVCMRAPLRMRTPDTHTTHTQVETHVQSAKTRKKTLQSKQKLKGKVVKQVDIVKLDIAKQSALFDTLSKQGAFSLFCTGLTT